ncbi:MAG: integration host factor subunit alpha [Caulobacterales bacterium]|jgi:integration host factor subunit alpha
MTRTLTRQDLAQQLHEKAALPKQAAAEFLEDVLSEIEAAIVRGDTVKLARFGNFVVRAKSERIGRNPKTGQEVPITPRRVATFRPSQILRARVEG